MCGRYLGDWDSDIPAILRLKERLGDKYPGLHLCSGDVYPTNMAPILVAGEEKADPVLMRWGYPTEKGLVINARSESAGVLPLFRDSFHTRRCAIVAAGFYEWAPGPQKTKYLFCREHSPVLYMAGLYDRYEGEDHFVVLTARANASVQAVHDRMPVVLGQGEVLRWLRDGEFAAELLGRTGPDLKRQVV